MNRPGFAGGEVTGDDLFKGRRQSAPGAVGAQGAVGFVRSDTHSVNPTYTYRTGGYGNPDYLGSGQHLDFRSHRSIHSPQHVYSHFSPLTARLNKATDFVGAALRWAISASNRSGHANHRSRNSRSWKLKGNDMTSAQIYPELSCYLLPGHTQTPADAIEEARLAEKLGLGKVWISERFDVKDAGVICSAALTATRSINVATAGTNLHTRHPHVLATMCSSLHYLSGGRFELGLARGVAIRNQLMGLDPVSNSQITDGLDILRKLWQGDKVMGYNGPMGSLPYLSSGDWLNAEIPIYFIGFGPKSLAFAGQHFDGVHLHTFVTPQGLKHARKRVTEGAEKAGRDPAAVKICAVMATIVNPDREAYLRKIIGRMATYMQAPGYVELLVNLNGWDGNVLETFRSHPTVAGMLGGIDSVATLEQLEEIESLIPQEWVSAAATGSPEECAARILAEFEHGANEVCLHGSTPDEFAPVLDAYRTMKTL